jgi:nucleoside-diphosphate-sugar epimerase
MVNFDEYRGKRVLITGGLGFIGSNIAHKLVAHGARVTIIDSLAPLYGGNKINVHEIRNDIAIRIGDFSDETLMRPLIPEVNVIFHLAAQVSYIDSSRIPLEDLEINCRGTLQLLELCRQYNRDVKVIFASSRLVLGKIVNQPVREDHPTEPLSLYGVHKLAAEKYHRLYASTHGIKTAVLRITNPYGERQQLKHSKYSLPGWFMRLAIEGKPIKIFGDGNQMRDYIYATDIADAFLSVGAAPVAAGDIFNCGFGRSVPFRAMAETIVRVLGKGSIEYVPWPENYEQVETGDVHFDTGKLTRCTGWKPSISLEQGIERMYSYFEPRLSHYFQSDA